MVQSDCESAICAFTTYYIAVKVYAKTLPAKSLDILSLAHQQELLNSVPG